MEQLHFIIFVIVNKSTNLLLPQLPFQRRVDEIAQELAEGSPGVPFGHQFQATA